MFLLDGEYLYEVTGSNFSVINKQAKRIPIKLPVAPSIPQYPR